MGGDGCGERENAKFVKCLFYFSYFESFQKDLMNVIRIRVGTKSQGYDVYLTSI